MWIFIPKWFLILISIPITVFNIIILFVIGVMLVNQIDYDKKHITGQKLLKEMEEK